MTAKIMKSYFIDEEAVELIETVSDKFGVTESQGLEVLLKEFVKQSMHLGESNEADSFDLAMLTSKIEELEKTIDKLISKLKLDVF